MRATLSVLHVGVIALLAMPLSICSAQEPMPDEFQVRAAIIVNLIRFVSFRSAHDDMRAPFRICLLGYDQQSAVLESYLSAHSIDGKSFLVRRLLSSDHFDGCQVLYVAGAERHHFDAISGSLRDAGVLTISDDRTFANSGGIVGLPVIGDRIEIQVNLVSAEQSGIAISSRLLALAKVIRKATQR